MNVDGLLSALRKVRKTAVGEWVACCPSHEDRLPSLSVKDCGDGRILLHCFSGCSVESIVRSLNLHLRDLMPDRALDHSVKPMPWNARTTLEATAWQATQIALYASAMANGKALSLAEKDQLWEMSGAIQQAIEYATRRENRASR